MDAMMAAPARALSRKIDQVLDDALVISAQCIGFPMVIIG
jgi:hypothetical protein